MTDYRFLYDTQERILAVSIWEEFRVDLLAYGITAGIAGLVTGPIYFSVRARRLVPLQHERPANWPGSVVCFAFISFLLVPLLTIGVLEELGFYEVVLGGASSPRRQIIWAAPLFTFVWLAILYWVTFIHFGVRPADFGMSRTWGLRYAVLGYASFLLLTPLILGLHGLILWILGDFFNQVPDKHPMEQLGKEQLEIGEWILYFFAGTVAAPVMEEVLCRGILQGWLRRTSLVGHIFVAILTVVIAGLWSLSAAAASEKSLNPGPTIFATLMAFVYIYFVSRSQQQLNAAVLPVLGSAMVWSAMHSNVWPFPIPLLPLGLALGYLAYRTQSLVPGIVFHGLFNVVASIGVMLSNYEFDM